MRAWITRDKSGTCNAFFYKPSKIRTHWYVNNCENDGILFELYDSDLPEDINPQWSDDEPIEVELKIERV